MSNGHAMEIEAREAQLDATAQASALIEFVQKRPWVAVFGAAAAGFVFARIVRGLR